jgi:hypothetical protein
LTGETGDGAVTLSVDPSAAPASAVERTAGLGEFGVVWRLHATANMESVMKPANTRVRNAIPFLRVRYRLQPSGS